MPSDQETIRVRTFPERVPPLKLVIQLEKILKQHFPGTSHRGIYTEIKERTGLSFSQIRAIRKSDAKFISMETLQKIASFLKTECGISTDELLGSFFGVEPLGFWAMFDNMECVQVCEGLRIDRTTAEPRWVNAYDAHLSATFIRQLLAGGGHPRSNLEQYLIQAYRDEQHMAAVIANAKDFYYRGFRDGSKRRALACIGSMKSLPVFECVVANAFKVKPFVPQTIGRRSQDLRQRAIPVYFRYREDDPDVHSAFGGRDLPLAAARGKAGVAYETDGGRWEFCPISESEDVAVVFYACGLAEGTVELALAGFSGRATGCLALGLSTLAEDLWPPTYSHSGLNLGLFLIRYTFAPQAAADSHTILVEPKATEVIAVPESVLVRRLEGVISESADPRRPR